jgi:hypothetical protein
MRLLARVSCAEDTPLSWFRSAHGATHGLHLSQREFRGFDHGSIRRLPAERHQFSTLDLDPTKNGTSERSLSVGASPDGVHNNKHFFLARLTWLTGMAELDLSQDSKLGPCLAKNGIHNPD